MDDLSDVLVGPGKATPPGDDRTVVAHPDPPAPRVGAVLVQGEVQGAFGTHGGIGGAVPAHEGFVVPQAQLALPAVAALTDGEGTFRVEVQYFTALVHLDGVSVDAWTSVLPRLPCAPPRAGQIEAVRDLPGELAKRDIERIGEVSGGRQDGLLFACLVAGELTDADAGSLGQIGL